MAGMSTTPKRHWFIATSMAISIVIAVLLAPECPEEFFIKWMLAATGIGLALGLILDAKYR